MSQFRWGILGTGYVARKFALGLKAARDARVVAIGSRSMERAKEFARALDAPRAYGSYEDLVSDPQVDAFYVATPPGQHHDHALLCLGAGKPVLVEKPFAVTGVEAREMAQAARARDLLCLDGMWTRFLPLVRRVKQRIANGAIGEPRMLTASFCSAETIRPDHWLYRAELGGGALLDRGIYPISLAFDFLGEPAHVLAEASIGETGVDEQVAAVFQYRSGALALLSASLRTQGANDCVIMGSAGSIHVHSPIYRPLRFSVSHVRPRTLPDMSTSRPAWMEAARESGWAHGMMQKTDRWREPLRNWAAEHVTVRYNGNGYHYEAEELMRCVRVGETDSPVLPLSETVRMIETIDTLRARWVPPGPPGEPLK